MTYIDDLTRDYLLPAVDLGYLRAIYDHVEYSTNDGLLSYEKRYRLYEGAPTPSAPKILIKDDQGLIASGRFKYPLRVLDPSEVKKLSDVERAVIEKTLRRWGLKPEETKIIDYLRNRMYAPIYRLRDMPHRLPWRDLIHTAINYGAKKDGRLQLIYKALLMRGFIMRFSPHTIISSNPATGKSAYLEVVGKRYDKVTPNSLIGFSKGVDEIHEGVVNHQIYAITIEEVEAQLAQNFFSFLLSFMEAGRANVSSGGVEQQVEGTAPIVITANPVGYDVDRLDSFRLLIDKLSDNQLALGRRIGIIAYGTDFERVKKDEHAHFDEEEWKRYIEFYRAVEERSSRLLQESVFNNDVFLKWLDAPIPGYDKGLLNAFNITDVEVKDFVESHLDQGYRHLRGGALAVALVDNMDKLCELALLKSSKLPDYMVSAIFDDANDALTQLVNINIGSLGNMSNLLQKDPRMEQAVYDRFPPLIKEIILTVKQYKANTQLASIPASIPFDKMADFMPKRYAKSVEQIHSLQPGRCQVYRGILRNHFGFHVESIGGNIVVIFSDPKKEITVE